LKPLSEYSREFKQIKKYIENGYNPAKSGFTISLQDVFAVSRPGEREEFDSFRFVLSLHESFFNVKKEIHALANCCGMGQGCATT
jgi:hypothetical protein